MIGRYHGFEFCYFEYKEIENNNEKIGICYLIKNNEPIKMLKIPQGEVKNIVEIIRKEIDNVLNERSESVKIIRKKVNQKKK